MKPRAVPREVVACGSVARCQTEADVHGLDGDDHHPFTESSDYPTWTARQWVHRAPARAGKSCVNTSVKKRIIRKATLAAVTTKNTKLGSIEASRLFRVFLKNKSAR